PTSAAQRLDRAGAAQPQGDSPPVLQRRRFGGSRGARSSSGALRGAASGGYGGGHSLLGAALHQLTLDSSVTVSSSGLWRRFSHACEASFHFSTATLFSATRSFLSEACRTRRSVSADAELSRTSGPAFSNFSRTASIRCVTSSNRDSRLCISSS